MFVTAGEVIEQLFGAFISWHTCTLKSRRRIASPEISTKRMSIFKLQHGMAGHKMVLRRSNMRERMSALGQLRLVRLMSALPPKADMVQHNVMSGLCQQQTCNPFVIARR